MKEIQEEMKKFQDDMKKAAEQKDEVALKKLKPREEQTMALMQEMMILPWKSLIVMLPLFFLFIGEGFITHYHGLLFDWFPAFSIMLPIDLHFHAIFSLQIFQQASYGPKGFFIVSTVFFSMIISLAEGRLEKSKKNAEAKK